MNTKILKQKILAKLLINDEWKTVKLGEICEVTSSKRIYQSEYVNDGVSFYRTKEVVELNNNQSISTVLFISEKRYNEIKNQFGVPQENDILISAVGTIGISWIVDKRKFYFKDGNLLWLRKINENSKFIKFFLDSIFCDNSFGHGGAYNALTIEKLKQFSIPLPPLSIQKSIVNLIERLFAEIDLIETARQELLQLVKTSKQKTLQLAITGELTNADTSTWKIVKLGEVCNQITDGTHKTPKYTTCGIPFLRVTDITESNDSKKFISENEHKELIKRCKPEKGDVLLSKNGTIGVAKVVDWNFEFSIFVSLCLIKPKNELDSRYLAYYLGSRKAISQMTSRQKTVTITNLHLEEIRELLIPLPPLSVQQQIVDKIETIFTEIETIEKLIRN